MFGFSLDSLFGKDKTGSVDNSQPWEHYSLISKFFSSELRKKRMKKNVVSNENGFLSVAVKNKQAMLQVYIVCNLHYICIQEKAGKYFAG